MAVPGALQLEGGLQARHERRCWHAGAWMGCQPCCRIGSSGELAARSTTPNESAAADLEQSGAVAEVAVLMGGRALALVCGLGLLAQASPARTDEVIGRPGDGGVITVRPATQLGSRQGLGRFVGISGANSGARTLSLNRVVIPPGAKARAHLHRNYETAIYLLQGTVETRYGTGLRQRVVNRAGDFIFIPADLPHQPVNLSATEPAIAIVTRSDPNEQESVELLDDAGQPLPAAQQHGHAHP